MARKTKPFGIAILVVLAAWGMVGVYQRFTTGHQLANYGSYVPWGLWVSGYIYFVGLSAGAFLLSSMVYVFRVESLRPIARPALLTAAITLGAALLSIWFDLGHMWRFYEVFTRPNFSSLMTWMVWLYSAYFLLILVELWLELRVDLRLLAKSTSALAPLYRILCLGWTIPHGESGIAEARQDSANKLRVFGAIGVPLAIAFHGGVGALFAGLLARPYWHTALYPILFLTGALVSGGGLLLFVVASTEMGRGESGKRAIATLAPVITGLLVFDLLLEWSEISIPAWYRIGAEYELLKTILFGEFWYVFWVFHLALGAVIPLALLIRKRSNTSLAWAGGLIAVTFMAVRLNLVVPGQITPQLPGLENAYVDSRLLFEYVPSMFEWSVLTFIIVLGIVAFFVGRRILPITHVEVPHAR